MTTLATSRFRRACALLLLLGTLVLASRLPLAPRRLFSYDSVNLAYAMEDFDPRAGHPQPPHYPLFVLQMRLMDWLGWDRPESIMLFLKLAASAAALLAIVWVGESVFAPGVGFCAAWLLLFHHSFWYGGLTSALRTQLALISLVVAGTCYPGWRGAQQWILASSMALGIGAGIRPELGVLLFPLYIVSLMRSGGAWPRIRSALALLAVIVLAWLVPTIIASGGLRAWLDMCWEYLQDQSFLTSGLFGAAPRAWWSSLVRLFVWTTSGIVIVPLLGILAWRREDGLGFGPLRATFLTLWLLPSFLFAAFVHVADAGHTLAMVPALCLCGGWLLHRGTSRLAPLIGREHALVVLLLPAFALNGLVFLGRFPLPKDSPSTRSEWLWLELHDAMHLTSLWQIRQVARTDDRVLDQLGRLAAEKSGNVAVIWDGGDASFVKASYYFPTLPVFAIARRNLRPGSPLIASKFLGPGPGEVIGGPGPISIPVRAGGRVVWIVNSAQPQLQRLRQQLPLREAGMVHFCDLPQEDGQADLGDYVLIWKSRDH